LPGHCLVYTIGIAPSPEAAQAVEAAAGSLIASLEPWRAQRDYANFAETDRRAEALYPADVLERLREVKRRVDPADIIRGCHPLG
jgi:hypothetical protein